MRTRNRLKIVAMMTSIGLFVGLVFAGCGPSERGDGVETKRERVVFGEKRRVDQLRGQLERARAALLNAAGRGSEMGDVRRQFNACHLLDARRGFESSGPSVQITATGRSDTRRSWIFRGSSGCRRSNDRVHEERSILYTGSNLQNPSRATGGLEMEVHS